MKLRRTIKKIISPLLIIIASEYLKRVRFYSYKGIRVRVSPGVFHPGLFFSTKILLTHLLRFDLKGKKVLELGAGSGLISICAAANGALSTATDISSTAINDLCINSRLNNTPVAIIQSDLFDNIPGNDFDFIIINPPYYPLDPQKESELAWYCGTEFQYYRKLFPQLNRFRNCSVKIIMILSEDCETGKISRIAAAANMELTLISCVRNWFEDNFIYSIGFIHPEI